MAKPLTTVPDASPLLVLPNGLRIIRRKRHEPIRLRGRTRNDIARLTNKDHGSKFLSDWNLKVLTQWTSEQVLRLGWGYDPGRRRRVFLRQDQPIGLASGKRVYTICIETDGASVHAYPFEDS